MFDRFDNELITEEAGEKRGQSVKQVVSYSADYVDSEELMDLR